MSGYSTIREILGEIIGQKLVEITQHDFQYFERTGRSFVDLMFDGGDVLRIYVTGGEDDGPCMALNVDDESEREMFQ